MPDDLHTELKHNKKWIQNVLQERVRPQLKKLIVPLIITFVLTPILISQIQFDKLILGRLVWIYLIPIAIGICCSYFVRACFFSHTLGKIPVRFSGIYLVTGVYSWIAVFLPFGLGHLSYPYLLEKCYKIKLSEGVSSLLAYNVIRVVILIGITLWAFYYIDGVAQNISIALKWDYTASITVGMVGVLFICTIFREKIFRKLQNVELFIRNVIYDLFKNLTFKKIGALLFFAITADMFNLAVIYFSFLFSDCSLSLPAVALIFGLINLSILLPIHGVGNFGSLEAVFALVLVGLGRTVHEAIQIGFVVHLVQLTVRTLIGLVCYHLLRRRS